jgi:rubrerythrin
VNDHGVNGHGEVPEDDPAGGEAACWLDRVCEVCGRLPDEDLTAGRCPDCGDPDRVSP